MLLIELEQLSWGGSRSVCGFSSSEYDSGACAGVVHIESHQQKTICAISVLLVVSASVVLVVKGKEILGGKFQGDDNITLNFFLGKRRHKNIFNVLENTAP